MVFAKKINLLCLHQLCFLEMFTNFSEAAAQRCSVKVVFLKISQNPQENTCT